MLQEIEDRHEVKIRKPRQCHDCQRKYQVWDKMIVSVWKDDDIYRLYECTECIDYLKKNPDVWSEASDSECMFEWWIKDIEPLPEFLSK